MSDMEFQLPFESLEVLNHTIYDQNNNIIAFIPEQANRKRIERLFAVSPELAQAAQDLIDYMFKNVVGHDIGDRPDEMMRLEALIDTKIVNNPELEGKSQ